MPTNLQSCGHQKEVRKHPQDTTARLTWTRRPETTESISATGSSVAETRAGPMNEHRQSRHCPTLLLWNLHERRKSNKERERERAIYHCVLQRCGSLKSALQTYYINYALLVLRIRGKHPKPFALLQSPHKQRGDHMAEGRQTPLMPRGRRERDSALLAWRVCPQIGSCPDYLLSPKLTARLFADDL